MIEIKDRLAEKIASIPSKTGIYQMKDFRGNIIYIGKSKNLRSRVKSYFNTQHKWNKINRLVFHIHDIDYIVTDTHLEAQLLECSLIKKFKPIYNAQFKNHQKYKYLKLEENHRGKTITIVDERENSNCIGPYRSKSTLEEIIKFFQHIYPICKTGFTYEYDYQLLPQPITKETFEENRDCLREIFQLRDSFQTFLTSLEKKMHLAAAEYQYEIASIYRDIQYHLECLRKNFINGKTEISCQKILVGERIEEGYKLFYIVKDRIAFTKKYKKLSKRAIEGFMKEAQGMEEKVEHINNEKKQIDFRSIIHSELKDVKQKSIAEVDLLNIEEFIIELKGRIL